MLACACPSAVSPRVQENAPWGLGAFTIVILTDFLSLWIFACAIVLSKLGRMPNAGDIGSPAPALRSSTCSSVRMRGALRAPEQGAFHDQRARPEPWRGPVARMHSAPSSAHSPRASLRLQDLISAGNGRPPLDLLQPSGARRARTRDAIVARDGQSGSAWRLRDRGR